MDKASGRDTARPELAELLRFAREGDTVVVNSMDRLARNLDDLRALVQGFTRKGVRVEFIKEPADAKAGVSIQVVEQNGGQGSADWNAIVWIADTLGADVHDRAHQYHQPVLLEKPDPEEGLTEAHVVAVQVFINDEDREHAP
jgi:hypothetical protein